MKNGRATERGGGVGVESCGRRNGIDRGHTTDGVIGSWEISRSLFLEDVSADTEVSIMMV